jgi:hypothetical protein
MNQPQDDIRAAVPELAHRLRWQRFSPSMGWRDYRKLPTINILYPVAGENKP